MKAATWNLDGARGVCLARVVIGCIGCKQPMFVVDSTD
jgi:hypothetical protein